MRGDLEHNHPSSVGKHLAIGIVGSGFITRDVQLVAYREAGYRVEGIASRRRATAEEVADRHRIPKVYDSHRELLADPAIQILDITFPPDQQEQIITDAIALGRPHLLGIQAQKPLGMDYAQSARIVEMCAKAGITLAVNQNMRYDQSIRALKKLLDDGKLGTPVLATIEMRAIPHWTEWLKEYNKLTLLVMSIHHLDCFRYLFGDPDYVYASIAKDPRTRFPHRDGIALYTLEYESGLRCSAWDDVWAGPAREGAASDLYIKWRVEGTEGMAEGYIGWPGWPNLTPSTMRYTTIATPSTWIEPQWKEAWFPDAFAGTMGDLLDSVALGRTPSISGLDNLKTIALVDACYRSVEQHRPVALHETTGENI